MGNGIIVDGISWPATLPLSQADQLITNGSLFLFDFGKQLTSAPASGATIPNLVRGGAAATVAAGGLTLAGGGLDWGAATGTNPRLNLGMYALQNRSVLWLAWVKLPATGTANAGVLGSATTTDAAGVNNQFVLYTGASGLQLIGSAFDGTNQIIYTPRAVDSPGLLYQVALEFNLATSQKIAYLNGVQVQAASLPGSTTLRTALKPVGVGSWNGDGASGVFRGRIHRVYSENLTVSGRTGASIVAADWAQNNGRFT